MNKTYCPSCDKHVQEQYYVKHIQTKRHLSKSGTVKKKKQHSQPIIMNGMIMLFFE